jgi:hypothetical protein
MASPTFAQRLAALIDDQETLTDASTVGRHAPLAAGVAHFPGAWTPQERGAFAERLLADTSIGAAQHPGVTRSRVRAMLPDHRKAQDEQMLQWFDAAQVLAPSITPDAPFRHPRRLTCTTPTDLLARLAATPHPIFNNAVEPPMKSTLEEVTVGS